MAKSVSVRADTKRLTTAAILAALIVVMTVVPYTGYIYYGLIEITTLHIVVIIGAAMRGWRYGAFLGLVWGISCVVRALTNPLWAPFVNPLVSVVPRIAVGAAAGAIPAGLKRLNCKPNVCAVAAAVGGTLTNTVLVLSALKLFTPMLEGAPLFGTIYTTLIGVNGILELVAAILLVPAVVSVIRPKELALGIDLGASTTKLALVQNGKCIKVYRKQDDETLEEALDRIGTLGVKRVALTGVGSSYLTGDIRGIPTVRCDEFVSLSRGACALAKKSNCLIVSVGTGTSFVRATPIRSFHIGGTGLGGGMLFGLASQMFGKPDMDEFQRLANAGDLHAVDIQLGDVCNGTISNLTETSTVANLAKATPESKEADLAAGLCNMIFQSIGIMAAFAVKKHLTRKIVLVGTITDWPIAESSLRDIEQLHHVDFIIPDNAAFATAIGAVLA